jgi:hypothetical protein
MDVDTRDGLEDPAPITPVLFTYPPDRYGLEETLRSPELVHKVVPAAILLPR